MLPLFLALYVRALDVRDRAKSDRGQGTLEYVGMIAVAALVVVAVAGALKGLNFGKIASDAVTKVTTAVG